jgi:hypothetical protein
MDLALAEKSVSTIREKQIALPWLGEAAAARLFVWGKTVSGLHAFHVDAIGLRGHIPFRRRRA